MQIRLFFCALVILIGCGPGKRADESSQLVDRGVAMMGRYQYSEAADVFSQAVQANPTDPDIRVNWAIAVLNRQGAEDTQNATEILAKVLAESPDHLRAIYCMAILNLYEGQYDLAKPRLETLRIQRPNDPYVHYLLGTIAQNAGQTDAALSAFSRAVEIDGYFQSAYYGLFQVATGAGKRDIAKGYLDEFRKLQNCLRVTKFDYVYGRMGHLAMAWSRREMVDSPPLKGPLFAEPVRLSSRPARTQGAVVFTSLDLDGDSDIDTIAWNAGFEDYQHAVWMNEGGQLKNSVDHPLQELPAAIAAAVGDIDEDGQPDLVLALEDGLAVYGLDGQQSVNETLAAATESQTWRDIKVLDADHDGDLDLWLLNPEQGPVLVNNNGNGEWKILELPAFAGGPWSRAFAADFDGDRDLDLGIASTTGEIHILWNDRLWSYRHERIPFEGRLPVAADARASGRYSLFAGSPSGVVRLDYDGGWKQALVSDLRAESQLAVSDFDGNGTLDVLALTNENLQVDRNGAQETVLNGAGIFHLTQLEPEKGHGLLVCDREGIRSFGPGEGRVPFMVIAARGRTSAGESMRSNEFGVGTVISARFQNRWASGSTLPASSMPGQSLTYVLIGKHPDESLHYLALQWSDGVYQVELQPQAGLWTIEETQRQLSSCPLLFVKSEGQLRFVSDVLGVGGIGFFHGPGQYGQPRPDERFLLPADSVLEPDVQLTIAEPMEEIVILDRVGLTEYQLPPGWNMTIDERMGTGSVPPTGRAVTYRHSLAITKASANGVDCTVELIEDDDHCAPTGDRHPRFIGLLDGTRILELDFGVPVTGSNWWLQWGGWVEYPYSQTVFGAWQAGQSFDPPSLEVEAPDGSWLRLHHQFGYPAGMDRESVMPLGQLPFPVRRIRLISNLEIYWDWVRLIQEETCDDCREIQHLPLQSRIWVMGFPEERGGHEVPKSFDAANATRLGGLRTPYGWYTELGDSLDLVTSNDSQAVFMAPGDAVDVHFRVAELPHGWSRRAVVDLRGWCKDMDLYTREGDQLEPLPVDTLTESRRRTRLLSGL